jgi:hypothetical protein
MARTPYDRSEAARALRAIPRTPLELTCVVCGQPFQGWRRTTMYCSNLCKMRQRAKLRKAQHSSAEMEAPDGADRESVRSGNDPTPGP